MFSVEKLFKEYYVRLCHFAWQLLNDKEMAEDVVQDAFMVYWNNKETIINNDTAIKNFLYSAVRNACYNLVRREKVNQRFLQLNPLDEIEEPHVLTDIIRSEVMVEIYGIIQSMPPGCQEIFRLGYLDGLSNTEIAEQLDISVNTVKTQKQRGLKLVKGKLNPELFSLLMLLLFGK